MWPMAMVVVMFVGLVSPAWAGAADDARAGLAAVKRGDYDEAIRLISRAIESGELSQGDQVFAYNIRGVAYRRKGLHSRAIADYNEAIKLKPDYAMAYSNRGLAYAKKGLYDPAIAGLTQAIELKPDDADAYFKRGNAYYDDGAYDRAIGDYTQAIKLKPDFVLAYSNRCEANEKQGRRERAIRDCRKALQLDPSSEEAKAALRRLRASP